MKDEIRSKKDEGVPLFEADERRARALSWAVAVAVSLLVNAALFAACCWKVGEATGWMRGVAP